MPPSWRSDKRGSTARGYGSRWQRERLHYLRANPLCFECQAAGRYTAASVVDHVDPHRGSYEKFWNAANWQSLCVECHNRKTQTEDRGKKPKRRIGIDGWPVD